VPLTQRHLSSIFPTGTTYSHISHTPTAPTAGATYAEASEQHLPHDPLAGLVQLLGVHQVLVSLLLVRRRHQRLGHLPMSAPETPSWLACEETGEGGRRGQRGRRRPTASDTGAQQAQRQLAAEAGWLLFVILKHFKMLS
jgi:hypothetical protein